MDFLRNIYHKSLAQTDHNIRFWEDYLNSLRALDFSVFEEKLKVPALVPVGSRIFFRGELKHTNEVMVALGADYFAKCSLKQAEVLRQHRIQGGQMKLDTFLKEKQHLENQLNFGKIHSLYEDPGQEIMEVCTDEEDKAWREQHRMNVKRYKQSERKEAITVENTSDDELWNRLEELELQEELDNEMINQGYGEEDKKKDEELSFKVTEDTCVKDYLAASQEKDVKTMKNDTIKNSPEWEVLQQVLDKQNELEEKLLELKNKEKNVSRTEQDLISRLDEMDELDELEDDMDRLDDLLQVDNTESEDETSMNSTLSLNSIKVKRSVSFADEDDSETLEINFCHSDVEPSKEPYDPKKGILKPSDIYEAHSHFFSGTISILKKSNYEIDKVFQERPSNVIKAETSKKIVNINDDDDSKDDERQVIMINDVIERETSDTPLGTTQRPASLFKKRRQQMK